MPEAPVPDGKVPSRLGGCGYGSGRQATAELRHVLGGAVFFEMGNRLVIQGPRAGIAACDQVHEGVPRLSRRRDLIGLDIQNRAIVELQLEERQGAWLRSAG